MALAGVLAGVIAVGVTAATAGAEWAVVVATLVILVALTGTAWVIVQTLIKINTTTRSLHARLAKVESLDQVRGQVHDIGTSVEALRRTYLRNADSTRAALGTFQTRVDAAATQQEQDFAEMRKSVTLSMGVLGRQQNGLAQRMQALEAAVASSSQGHEARSAAVTQDLKALAAGNTDLSLRANALLGLLNVRTAELDAGEDK
ncbi:hypothetical protein [Janibacter sp. DB-40]|uniref:hypothetical protein n=1 Tax=Janibacter sp. DB-40 TaxID=3028808 RepID=UPI002405F0F9|nr:hypothetical protein [Janibacter sp. DB-40]